MADTEGVLRSTGPVTLVGLLVALYLAVFGWAASRVFLLNFSPEGPNATAGLVVLFVTGWSVGAVALLSPGPRALYAGGTGLASLGILASVPADPALSGLAAVLALTALTPPLVGLLSGLRGRAAVGAAGGVLFVHAVRAWRDTASPYATAGGEALLVAVSLGAVALAVVLVRVGALESPDPPAGTVSGVPLFAFLFAQATFLGHPHAVARWALRPAVPALAASALGILAGVGWIARRGPPGGWGLTGAGLAYALAVGALLFAPATDALDPAVLALVPAQAGAVALLGAGSRPVARRSIRRTVAGLAGAQFALVALLFLFVGAVNAAFMPVAVRPVLSGLATPYLLALHLALPVAAGAVAVGAGDGPGESARSTPAVDHARRATLSAAALGVGAVAGGVATRRSGSPDEGSGPPYRLLTLNVHRYIAGNRRGDFALEGIRRLVDESGADVVGLQESDGTRVTTGANDGVAWLADRLGYHARFGAPGRAGSPGVALLSRWPIRQSRVVFLPIGRSVPRPTLVATVDAPDGPLPVVVTHFEVDKQGDRQADQARNVVDLTTVRDRAVVLGDCNVRASGDDEAYRILKGSLADAWTAAGHPETGGGYTYPAGDPDRRIDYVWLHGDWAVGSATTLGGPGVSDHLGVLATVDPG